MIRVLELKIPKLYLLYRAYGALLGSLVIGGFNGSTNLASSEFYNIFDGIWQQAFPDLPVELYEHCIANLPSDDIIIIGGILEGRPSKKTYIFSNQLNNWYEGPELNVPRSGAGCGAIDNNRHVIVAGGYNDDGHLHTSEVNFTYIRVANLPKLTVTLFLALSRSSE